MPAFADVTPEQVWQNWLDYYKSAGYDVTEGNRELAGDTLTLKDVAFAVESEGSNVSFVVPQVELQATGDGKVRSVYSDEFPVLISGKTAEDKDFELTANLSLPGNEMTSSGEVGDLTHEYDYPSIVVSLDKIRTGSEEVAIPTNPTFIGNTGSLRSTSGDESSWDYTHKTEDMTFKLNVQAENPKVNLDGSIKGVEIAGKMAGAKADVNMQDNLSAALKEGLNMDGKLNMGDLALTFDFAGTDENGAPQSGSGTVSAAPSDLFFAMSSEGLTYQGNGGKVAAEVTMMPLPFPISYGMESSTFDMQFPVSASDDAQPFKFGYSLAGLTIGDQIWDMFDPTKQLSRDPANLEIDLTGQLKVLRDLLDPATSAAATDPTAPDAAPFEPVEIVINQLALKAIGANIEANGKLEPSEAAGMDQPQGNLHVRFSGVAEVVQKLAQMGLLPPDQVMAVNAMIGAFGKEDPSNPGTRTIDIEMRDDGSVFANGQQVQ
ncbi:DUF2125 domain-containing protein [Paracoccus sp. DMF-8]|uniref:DUF2125 domain-containing protein n=1 Tax=Paracoccus sp. DMF-8 TaxID=3019445 RepID=UPI0023E40FD4|nr:DUF2125 domain-containing protein [Paracoccus sp. DMF-8]MDF3607299.1 DUF2125 domain-containing protein [Paracoccus sp. DMF-8]